MALVDAPSWTARSASPERLKSSFSKCRTNGGQRRRPGGRNADPALGKAFHLGEPQLPPLFPLRCASRLAHAPAKPFSRPSAVFPFSFQPARPKAQAAGPVPQSSEENVEFQNFSPVLSDRDAPLRPETSKTYSWAADNQGPPTFFGPARWSHLEIFDSVPDDLYQVAALAPTRHFPHIYPAHGRPSPH